MVTLEKPIKLPDVAVSATARELTLIDLQLQVARRADALARRRGASEPDGDRRLWLRAECEVFDRGGRGAASDET